ncbi:hypothetical protein [Laceyella sacchari]|uniref:GNAT family N-acetyltransferase n=1 Tax=Laceyella sacchari TaxID=37482 RepID=A0ABY5TZ95_LACSH|nr:hypothetical protein NYR52_11345 [Laceyella sacchari]
MPWLYKIWKLEVLPQYRERRLGRALVAHAHPSSPTLSGDLARFG